ncbi:MAG: prepilin-type N-terminal cleavage/methylation domain-containing protein [Clostridia bacterium]
MKKRNNKGFTLVELIVVIVIIAILAGVLIPTFSGVIDRAHKSTVLQEATNIKTMFNSVFMADTTTYPATFTIGDDKVLMEKLSGDKLPADAKLMFFKTAPTVANEMMPSGYITTTTNEATTKAEILGFVYQNGDYTAIYTQSTGAIVVVKTYKA